MQNLQTLHYEGKPLAIVLEDVLDHPYYEWPLTLISYRLTYEATGPLSFRLTEEMSGQNISLQLSAVETGTDGRQEGILRFFTALPSGGRRVYRLEADPPHETMPVEGEAEEGSIRMSQEGAERIIGNGCLRIAFPEAAFTGQGFRSSMGPLYRIGRHESWLGEAHLRSSRPVCIRAEVTEAGPLLIIVRLCCRAGEAVYRISFTLTSGMEFVEIDEEMRGFGETATEAETEVVLETLWTNFQPTHRYAPNRPYKALEGKTGFDRYPFEEINRQVTDTHMEMKVHASPDSELPFCLLPYEPWQAFERLNLATFWDNRSMDSVGIYIRQPEFWDDGLYSIWRSDRRLAILYYYRDGRFSWKHPVRDGSRSTAVCCYDHRRDIEEVERLERLWQEGAAQGRGFSRGPASYTLWLQQWYDLLSLDKLKGWTLTYPEDLTYPGPIFESGLIQSVSELEEMLLSSELVCGLALYGPCQDQGFSPVPSRAVYASWADAFHRLREQMTPAQRRRITGLYLLMAYMHASEDYMPMKRMLAGHPNFLADVKGVPALLAVLFPEHPCAQEWVSLFDRSLELNLRYHVRPDHEEYGAVGGRWTENLGCYVWAFLKPVMKTAYMLKYHYDGQNHLHHPALPKLARWILSSLTSPFLGPDMSAPRRMLLPQGAHAKRKLPPWSFRQLGYELLELDPGTAEAILAVTAADDPDFEPVPVSAWDFMRKRYPDHQGTEPSWTSSKHTGYGIALRAAGGKAGESFVLLQQLDQGFNYRWGVSGQGGCGVIYYYAAGRAFSHNGHEDVGDHRLGDTELCTNFGVFKQGTYRCIGPNTLHRPLVDLHSVSFAELVSAPGESAYAWPDYVSRSVMMAGTDYIVVYDAVFNSSVYRRFSWFAHRDEELPHIHPLYGNVTKRTELSTDEVKGIWLDGTGDFMTLVTPGEHLAPQPTPYGCTVSSGDYTDLIFRRQRTFRWEEPDLVFEGTSGWIRNQDGRVTAALVQGREIGYGPLGLRIPEGAGAAELTLKADGTWCGICQAEGPLIMEIRTHPSAATADELAVRSPRLLVNAVEAEVELLEGEAAGIRVALSGKGTYVLEYADHAILPNWRGGMPAN